MKAAFAFCSNVVGAVILTWLLPALSFYMLYVSYSNLNKYKAWLAINNPSEIWWIRYLVRPIIYQIITAIKVNLHYVIFRKHER